MSYTITIDDKLEQDAQLVLDRIGLDMDALIRMTLKRAVLDEGISFLVGEQKSKKKAMPCEIDRMTKNKAISLFAAKGVNVGKNVTFASKNKMASNYWANPMFEVLTMEWCLILNDWVHRTLFLFRIPLGTVLPTQLVKRRDQQERIDLQICYSDPTFTDNRSKLSFAPFLVEQVSY